MKISYQWLREFVDIEVLPRQLAEDLTNVGIAVETIESLGSDHILDLDLASNRPDCLSHFGVAREVAVLYRKRLHQVTSSCAESAASSTEAVSVEISSPQLCSRYSARVIRGVKVGPSPDWLVQRLETLGVRSINNVADVTNYVLMELGHPLHAFDLEKIEGRRILVREAEEQEFLVTLDGEERHLNRGMLVIADGSRAVALAGIMGGLESEIGFSTYDVLLESAWLDPVSIRRTSKELGMHTEASHRFERGADVSATVFALDRTAALIQQLAGGEILQGVVDAYPRPVDRGSTLLRKSRIQQVMGMEVDSTIVEDLLNRLDFKIAETLPGGWQVLLPTFRLDVEREIDLVEEVARHHGYDKFPSTLPLWKGEAHRRPEHSRESVIRERLFHLGYSETCSYSFVDQDETRKFSLQEPVPLMNPLSSEMGVMRSSLLPGLTSSLMRNYNRGIRSVRLYEMGRVFYGGSLQFKETMMLGLIATGNATEKGVHCQPRPFSFFDLKGDVEALWGVLSQNFCNLEFRRMSDPGLVTYYHPGVVAELYSHGRQLGILGRLHPRVADNYKIKQPVFVAELPLAAWYGLEFREKGFAEIPKFPAIQRDLSIVVDREVEYSRIESVVWSAGIPELQKITPFDLYFGEDLPTGKKAIAFSVVYLSLERTLIEEEVNRFQEIVLERLHAELDARLRS